jgi:hypothetical protein
MKQLLNFRQGFYIVPFLSSFLKIYKTALVNRVSTRYISKIRKSRPLSQARDGLFGLDIGCGVRQDITAPFIISNRASDLTTRISAFSSSHFLSSIHKIQYFILKHIEYNGYLIAYCGILPDQY